MSKLSDIQIKEILPSSISEDQNVQDIGKTADAFLHDVFQKTKCILLLPNLDTLPEEVVDSLAWQYHVDFYEMSMSLTKKRSMVREAIYWHLIKGTPAAVEKVVAAVFQTAQVQENWEYEGDPYYFRVHGITEPLTDGTIDRLVSAINSAKNCRSWLEGIGFDRDISMTIRHLWFNNDYKEVTIGLPVYHVPDVRETRLMVMPINKYKEVVILPAYNPPRVQNTRYMQTIINIYKEEVIQNG